MSAPTVAVLGGTGDVGSATVRALLRLGSARIRVGGRDTARAREFAAGLAAPGLEDTRVEAAHADTADPASLDRFASGCAVLVNCAGPSHRVGSPALAAAVRAGAHYVDPAGDEPLLEATDPGPWLLGGRCAVLSAGMQPGLTGLAPRWLAEHGFDRVDALTCYFGVLDRFTETAAQDYLHGTEQGRRRMLAAWRDGVPRAGALVRRSGASVPFFPAPATLLPYLDPEAERLARGFALGSGTWSTVVVGEHALAAFDRAHTLDRAAGVAALCRASRLDLAGRSPYAVCLVQLDGEGRDGPRTRTALVRGPGNTELSGGMAAATAVAVLEGEVPPGVHYAASALEPGPALERLARVGAVTERTVLPLPVRDLELIEEGAL